VCNSKFQESAFGLLEELYKSDQVKTKQLVKRPLKNWNGSSVYKLAVEADFPNFKTHDSFQGCLDEMWYGELRTNVPLWKVRHFAVCVCACVCVMIQLQLRTLHWSSVRRRWLLIALFHRSLCQYMYIERVSIKKYQLLFSFIFANKMIRFTQKFQ